jgi:hypothetical protein
VAEIVGHRPREIEAVLAGVARQRRDGGGLAAQLVGAVEASGCTRAAISGGSLLKMRFIVRVAP